MKIEAGQVAVITGETGRESITPSTTDSPESSAR